MGVTKYEKENTINIIFAENDELYSTAECEKYLKNISKFKNEEIFIFSISFRIFQNDLQTLIQNLFTMNRVVLLSCFLLALMLIALSCKKDDAPTVIKGAVTDRKTEKPIEDAFVYFRGTSIDDLGREQPASCTDYTDASGQFNCTLLGTALGVEIGKTGYATKIITSGIIDGQENEVSAQLVPRDGFLKLTIENDTGSPDALYVYVYSIMSYRA